MMSENRLFIAVDLPPDHLRALSAYARNEERRWPGSRWTAQENYHITVCFLGDVEAAGVDALKEAVGAVAAGIIPFSLSFRSMVQAPPHRRSTSMIWAVYGGDEFEHAAKQVRWAAEKFAPEIPEEQEHIPHITVARFRDRAIRPSPPKLNDTLEPFIVKSFSLYSSELAPGGSIYTKLAELPLSNHKNH